MEESFTLGMSLMDFLPPIAFLLGAFSLVKLARHQHNQTSSWLLTIGGIITFLSGLLQAIWKFLYTLGIGDIRILRDQQFVLMALGFLLMFLGVLMFVRKERTAPAMAAMAAWKIPFLATMTLCSIGMEGILTHYAFQKGMRLAGALFIVAVLCLFAMSGMASGEQSASRQWIEQSINLIGQSAFALGSYLLYRQAARP